MKNVEGCNIINYLLRYTADVIIIDLISNDSCPPIEVLGKILRHRSENDLPIGVLGIVPDAEHKNVKLAADFGIDLIIVAPIDEETLTNAMDQLYFS